MYNTDILLCKQESFWKNFSTINRKKTSCNTEKSSDVLYRCLHLVVNNFPDLIWLSRCGVTCLEVFDSLVWLEAREDRDFRGVRDQERGVSIGGPVQLLCHRQ